MGIIIPLPLEIVALGELVQIIAIVGLGVFIVELKKYAPEAFIFRKARKDNRIVKNIGDMDGNSEFTLGEKEEPGDIVFKDKTFGDKLDPSMVQGKCIPSRYSKGLVIYNYATGAYYPTSAKDARGFTQIIETRQKPEYDILDFLSDEDIIQLLDTPREERIQDIKIFTQAAKPKKAGVSEAQSNKIAQALLKEMRESRKYRYLWDFDDEIILTLLETPQDEVDALVLADVKEYQPHIDDEGEQIPIDADSILKKVLLLQEEYKARTLAAPISDNEVLRKINELEDEVSKTPITDGAYSLAAAYRLNPNAHTAQDLQQFENNIFRKVWKMLEARMNIWNNPLLWAIALIMAGSIGIYVTSMAF